MIGFATLRDSVVERAQVEVGQAFGIVEHIVRRLILPVGEPGRTFVIERLPDGCGARFINASTV